MLRGWIAGLSTLCLAIGWTEALTCMQQDDPRNPLSKIQVNCSPSTVTSTTNARLRSNSLMKTALTDLNSTLSFQGLLSPVTSILSERPLPEPIQNVNVTNMFTFDLLCPQSVGQDTCNKANATVYHAGQLISNVLALTSLISVNVTISSFCTSQSVCTGDSEIISLAAAAPARTIPLIDDDGITRLYPQAAVKQFVTMLNGAPQFSQYDINLNVNSDTSFYYPGLDTAITSNEMDFLFVVLHELMHGLGFTSSYEDYFHEGSASTITPNVLLSYSANQVVFEGFIESAFDKSFIFTSTAAVTDLVKTMNRDLTDAMQNETFTDTANLTSYILAVPSFDTISQSLTNNFTTANTTYFLSGASNASIALQLETSIKPYSSGSSISHLAADTYAGTGDFLMRASLTKGVSLAQTIQAAKTGGAKDTDLYGAIGPGLRSVLSNLGYRVRGGLPTQSQIMTTASIKTNSDVTSHAFKRSLSYSSVILCIILCCL